MNIQLEHKTQFCPDKLLCTVCGQLFQTRSIRALLYNHARLLQGDVCKDCLGRRRQQFRQKLHDRACLLQKLSALHPTTPDQSNRALELLEAAQEPIHFPAPYQWWWKKLTLLSQETETLENARLGHHETYDRTRSRLNKLLERDRDVN